MSLGMSVQLTQAPPPVASKKKNQRLLDLIANYNVLTDQCITTANSRTTAAPATAASESTRYWRYSERGKFYNFFMNFNMYLDLKKLQLSKMNMWVRKYPPFAMIYFKITRNLYMFFIMHVVKTFLVWGFVYGSLPTQLIILQSKV